VKVEWWDRRDLA